MGTILAGRNIGLFGQDAILGDMTLLGVGTVGSNAAPANTSLGSIGLGYIYTDWLAQIDYTTPDISGFKFTVGIFDPVEPLGPASTPKAARTVDCTPSAATISRVSRVSASPAAVISNAIESSPWRSRDTSAGQ